MWSRVSPLTVLVAVSLLVAACGASNPSQALSAGGGVAAPATAQGAADTATPRPLEKVRIGYPSRSVTFLSMLLARDQGYFQQEGIDPDLSQIKTNVGITALLNGELDYTESVGTNIRSALQGAPIKTVMTSMRAPVFVLVARPEFTSVEQLRGHTVGITNFGGSNDQTAQLIFEHFGLEPQKDVQLVPVGDAPVQYEVLKQGQIDSIVVSLPFPLLAQREGYRLLVNAPDIVSMPLAGLGTLQTTLDTRRDQVKRVVKAEIQALDHIRTHPDDAIALIADLFETDQATARDAYTYLLPSFSEDGAPERAGVETILKLEQEDGPTPAPATYEQVADASVAAEARAELGPRP
ncbi:MAG TPA: ABC transporter substrate-binding protein [Chloroflexota bacterium]|nr:ABC transporter substrate-binding protein [Chloroflexota bacterium]